MAVETGGNCGAKGKSGEGGCLQYMPGTWKHHSHVVYGEIREMTPERERYVATAMVQRWLDEGYSQEQIPLLWNQGNASRCKAGTNKFGVRFDSCAYQQHVLAYLR